jgi:CheY-like chemotaxis protein
VKAEWIEIKSNMRIVLASSNPEHVLFLSKQLSDAGLRNFVHIASGLELFDHLQKEVVDLVVIDTELKYIDGWRVLKTIKNSDKILNVACLLVGSVAISLSKADLEEYGVMAYLSFPIALKDLMDAIRRSLMGSDIEKTYTMAKEKLVNHQPVYAIPLYNSLMQLTQQSHRSTIGLVQAHEQADQLDEALELIDTLDVVEFDIMWIKFKFNIDRQSEDEMLPMATDLMAVMDALPFYYYNAAKLSLKKSRYRLCEMFCKEAVRLNFRESALVLVYTKALLSLAESKQAYSWLVELEKKEGLSLELCNLKGVYFMREQKYEKALQAYQQALTFSKQDYRLYFNLALCQLSLNSSEKAAFYLKECLKLNPGFEKASEKLGQLLLKEVS